MKRKIINICLIVLGILLMMGCSKEAEEEEITTGFDSDTVFTVSDKKVSLAEWYLYALPVIEETETLYGSAIWDFVVDTKTQTKVWNLIKDEIKDKITYVKIISSKAAGLDVSLNEDEQMDVSFSTAEYLESLSSDIRERYGIAEEVVRDVYSDNLLAMKVYENLTLNIDTTIPEEQVRHMVLQYVSVPKSYEDEEGNIVGYSEEEIDSLREKTEAYYNEIKADADISRLSEVESEDFAPIEIISDYKDLTERLPGDLPGIAFALRQDEISGVFETEDAFFILNCANRVDEETTNKARVEIIEERQRELFESEYQKWAENVVVKFNYNIWDSISLGE